MQSLVSIWLFQEKNVSLYSKTVKNADMVTVTLEYNNNNAVLNGILDAIAKMPDVKIMKDPLPNKVKAQSAMLSDEELYRLADDIKISANPNAPVMTMEEIVQEVRDYRDGK